MKTVLIASSVLLVLSVYCFSSADGLECYFCGHADGLNVGDADFFHKSCKSGKKPDKKFKTSCDGAGFGDGFDACGKMHFKGEFNSEKLDITLRSCIPTIPEIENTCSENSVQDVLDNENTPEDIKDLLRNFPDKNLRATLCSCDTDNCNSGSMLQITHGLVMISFAFLASKFAGII